MSINPSPGKGLEFAPQLALLGRREVVGAFRGHTAVREIEKERADQIIRANHYSGTVSWSSNEHFGIYDGDELVGAIQFGPAMNPAAGARIVRGSQKDSWCELNRLWIHDLASVKGSSAISLAIRVLRHRRPGIEWVQSFADERCGKMGGLYQAASFLYLGSHVGGFYELDGEFYHRSMMGRAAVDSRGWGCGDRIEHLNKNRDRATYVEFKQYRYVRLLTKSSRGRLEMPVLPYPKESQA